MGLRIQVNGSGMIPRGYGLAPRKEPFMANDIHFINLILNTSGLSVKFVNPETNQLQEINKKNLKQIWDKYANYKTDGTQKYTYIDAHDSEPDGQQPAAPVESAPDENPSVEAPVEETQYQVHEEHVEEPAATIEATAPVDNGSPAEEVKVDEATVAQEETPAEEKAEENHADDKAPVEEKSGSAQIVVPNGKNGGQGQYQNNNKGGKNNKR